MEKKRPTMRELAVLAGYSPATISLALRNHRSLPDATRDRILKIAQENGYTSDPVVTSLMTQLRKGRQNRSIEKIAFLTWWDTREGWHRDGNSEAYFRGACSRAERYGFEVEAVWAREAKMTGARLSKMLHTRGIRGIVIGPLERARGHVALDWRYFSCAGTSFTVVSPAIHRASHSHYHGMRLCVRKLKHYGYKRVGFFTLRGQVERTDYSWLAGYLIHQEGLPQASRVPVLLQKDWDQPQLEGWLARHQPDAVVSNMPYALDLLRATGRNVPQDLGFAALDLRQQGPSVSGVDQCPEEIGAAALDMVTAQLYRNELGLPRRAQTLLMDGEWREAATAPPRR